MNTNFANKHTDDPNALTTEDRDVMEKTDFTPGDIKDSMNDKGVGESVVEARHFPETGFKLIVGILLVISGLVIGISTANSVIGLIFGALMAIAGIILPFVSFGGAGVRNRGAV